MGELVHITARIEPETRDALKAMAKARMMKTGEAVTLADMVREGLAKFADSELTEDSPAPAKPAPAEEQLDMLDQVVAAADKPKKKAAVTTEKKARRTPEEMSELRRQALELQENEGLSGRKIAVRLGLDQTLVSRYLLK